MREFARRCWIVAEPFHALTYLAPEAHDAFARAGLRGFWRGYFAGRAAPLGPVDQEVVTATFFGFAPAFVARAVPAVWSMATPEAALVARLDGVDAATRRIFDAFPERDADRVARVICDAAAVSSRAGRPLFAANTALAAPEAPHLALWHASTLLREHRGDGHVLALLAAEIDPTEAHVLRVADDEIPLSSIQPYRGWSIDDWATAEQRLCDRGWLDDDGHTTPLGHDARMQVEADTDRLSREMLERIPPRERDRVLDVLAPLTAGLRAAAVIEYPNPMGVPPAPASP